MSDAAHMNRYGIPTVNYGSAGRIHVPVVAVSLRTRVEAVHIDDMLILLRFTSSVYDANLVVLNKRPVTK